MNNRFVTTIAGNAEGIRRKRAESTALAAKLSQESLINEKRRIVQALEAQLNQKLDLGPDTADSLRPVDKGFNAEAWVGDVHNLKVQLKRAVEQLDIAEATYREWFEELPAAATALNG